MNHLLNHMFLAANRAQMNIGYAQLGIITSVNPVDYSVKVLLQPEEVETGFIPFCTPFYGWVAPPAGGEQCLVLFQRGNPNLPIAALLIYWDNGRAPGKTSQGDTGAGEMLLKHSSGSYVKLSNDGKITINGHTEIDITTPVLNVTTSQTINLAAATSITVQAPTINLNGNVTLSGTLTTNDGNTTIAGGVFTTNANIITSQDVQASGVSLKTHVHSGGTESDGNTGAPV